MLPAHLENTRQNVFEMRSNRALRDVRKREAEGKFAEENLCSASGMLHLFTAPAKTGFQRPPGVGLENVSVWESGENVSPGWF